MDCPELIECASAEEFLLKLAPESGYQVWRNVEDQNWIFRGVNDADHELVPSAFREEGKLLRTFVDPGQDPPLPVTNENESRELELQAVYNFVALADAGGYSIPGDSEEWRRPLSDEVHRDMLKQDPFPKPVWTYALAQHHRVPTRLLDWTFRYEIASYFAAVEAAKKQRCEHHEKRLAVWAMSVATLNCYQHRVQLISPPTASNPNLRRQSGLFTMVTSRHDRDPWPVPRIDQILAEAINNHEPAHAPLFKVTLPWSEAPLLLYLLSKRDVSSASVFEGLDAVRAAFEERRLQSDCRGWPFKV